MMKLSPINTISFKGKIIDSHAHFGHWGNNQKYFGQSELDVFLKNPLNVNIDGIESQDNIEKMIISPLDAIGINSSMKRLNETEGLKQALEFAKSDDRICIMPVCQPNLTKGNIESLRKMINENPQKIVGLKFHPRKLLELSNGEMMQDNSSWYDNYFKLAEEKKLPCLFHCDFGESGAEKIYNLVRGKYPDLPIILGHTGAGGNKNFQEALSVLKKSIDNKDAKIYADISWLDWKNDLPDGNHEKVKTLITELKSRNAMDRILFGTDSPLGCFGENPVDGVSPKEAYEKTVSGIKTMIKKNFRADSEEITEKIFYKNANDLFFPKEIQRPPVKKSKLSNIIAITSIVLGACALLINTYKSTIETSKNSKNLTQTQKMS